MSRYPEGEVVASSSDAYRTIKRPSTLSAPNPDDPLDTGVADHWKTNEKGAMENARQWTAKYATGGGLK